MDSDSIAPALTVLILEYMADSAERGDVSRHMGEPPVYIPGGEDASGNRHGKDCRWISASVYSCVCGLDERRRLDENRRQAE